MNTNLDHELLSTFIVFAEEGGFTAASRRLHLGQPAVYAQVQRLSQALGVPLYRRVGRGLELTEEGREVEAYAREISERTRQLTGRLHGGESTRPRLAAGRGTLLHLLAGPIGRFIDGEGVRPEILVCRGPEAADALVRGRAHLAVAALLEPPATVHGKSLAEVGQVVLLPETHPLARRPEVSASELSGEPLVVPGQGGPHRRALGDAFLREGAEFRPVAEVDDWELMRTLVQAGMGLAIVNAYVQPLSGTVAVPFVGLPTRTVALWRRRRRVLPPEAERLAQFLRGEV